jgi:large subunit ribosomal protein L9
MEVILRAEVEKLGHPGDTVKVAPGYARNFLLPRGLAMPATDSNRKIVEQVKQSHLRKEAKLATDAQELAKMMSSVSVTIHQRAGEEDVLFGSVTAQDITNSLEKQGYCIAKFRWSCPFTWSLKFKAKPWPFTIRAATTRFPPGNSSMQRLLVLLASIAASWNR